MAEAIEEARYRHRQPPFGAVAIAFFDMTSLWFERFQEMPPAP